MSQPSTTYIELLRHGLPQGEQCFRGHTEFELTEQGREQMHQAVQGIETVHKVISSPRVRCLAFAKQFAAQRGVELQVEAGFQELNFGDWDGKEKQQVWESQQQHLMSFWDNPWQVTPPNGERLIDFDQRIAAAWQHLVDEHQGQSVLVITHGGVIKQLLRQMLDMPRNSAYLERLTIPYASRVSVSVYRDEDNKLWPQIVWPNSA